MVRESATCTALAVVRPSLGKRKTEEVGGQDISPYAARLPKFQATGNYYDKQAAGQDYHELQEIITGCQRNRSLIRILYGKYTEAQRMTTQGPLLDMAVCFQPEAKTIYNLPDEFVCPWLKKNTDLTSDQLVRIRSKDPKSPHKMLCYKVQLPETFRLEGELQNISLCEHFLDKREKDMGFRMSAPAKSKHVGEDGGVFWLDCSSWRTVFSESFLKTVTYVPTGDVVEVDIDELAVKETWSPVNFHLDLQAAYQYKKMYRYACAPCSTRGRIRQGRGSCRYTRPQARRRARSTLRVLSPSTWPSQVMVRVKAGTLLRGYQKPCWLVPHPPV